MKLLSKEMQAVITRQVADEGLWFISATAPETYLQEALRNLHRYVEEMWIPKVVKLEERVEALENILRKCRHGGKGGVPVDYQEEVDRLLATYQGGEGR